MWFSSIDLFQTQQRKLKRLPSSLFPWVVVHLMSHFDNLHALLFFCDIVRTFRWWYQIYEIVTSNLSLAAQHSWCFRHFYPRFTVICATATVSFMKQDYSRHKFVRFRGNEPFWCLADTKDMHCMHYDSTYMKHQLSNIMEHFDLFNKKCFGNQYISVYFKIL